GPNADPLGQCLRASADTMPCRTVVGVAEDVKIGDVAAPASLMFYFPAPQSDEGDGNLMIRVRGSAVLQADALRRDLQHLMPGAAHVVGPPVSQVLQPASRSWRLCATTYAAVDLLALALSAIRSF